MLITNLKHYTRSYYASYVKIGEIDYQNFGTSVLVEKVDYECSKYFSEHYYIC